MDTVTNILADGKNNRIFIERAGMATCASLAAGAVARGRSVVLAVSSREEFNLALFLARLFLPDLSCGDYPVAQPVWTRPLLAFPASRHGLGREVWLASMANFYALARHAPRCVIVSMQSLLLRYMPTTFFDGRTLELAPGDELAPDLIVEQAVEWGYTRVAQVTAQGEMARRGDILDIFPAGYAKPLRLEFFGDNIEDMRMFDSESQRSLQNLDGFTLVPACPFALDPGSIAAAEKNLDVLLASGKLNENQAYSIKKRLEEGGRDVLPGMVHASPSFFEDWLPGNALWILQGEAESAETLAVERQALKDSLEDENSQLDQPAAVVLRRNSQPAPWNSFQCLCSEPLRLGVEEKGISLPERNFHGFAELFPLPEEKDRPWQTLVRAIKSWQSERRQTILAFSSERGRKKFLGLAGQDGITPFLRYDARQSGIYALVSPYASGAELVWDNSIILGEDIMYPRADKRSRRPSRAFKGLDNFGDLKDGDLVVHRDYGIGRFAGLKHLEINNAANDFLLLEYSGNDRLYVPMDRLGLIQRFRAQEGVEPALDRLGAQAWANGREKARKAIEKIAADLVEMYAYRKVAKSFRYNQPDELYREFEATFAFEETPDQARAIQDVLDDMEKNAPMDRLVCGDVGFGKTEVALRAAFRAAAEGRQVALLCPTTVLAEQHYQTFRSRLSGFPVNVGLLSRFVPRARQKETLRACELGQIDILIGTHRILSSDVKLPNLALLILDEEQRFGVRHKEKLKAMKKNVDVLTLTATPIPRTLQLSMSGIRDLSVIETAPMERKPVASAILRRDDDALRKIMQREIDRQGQIFWVYNRVQDIGRVVEYVKNLAPDAKVGMAHGQMSENELENAMRMFWHGELDVLVCTSIIESGLDFPRANTLIVDQAQMFGLGQLYQLRGRVGRSDRQAYAYFVTPPKLSDLAEERLRIILDMDYLGAGFQVAMEDLRLRGAGNILGEVQSGHMSRVGLDMYLEMLEEAVNRLKGLPETQETETEINLGLAAHIPANYIEDGRERLHFYKALTSAQDAPAREEIALAMRDRYGHFPQELRNFLAVLDFKQFLGKLQVERADIHQDSIKLVWRRDQAVVQPEQLVRLVSSNDAIKLAPPSSMSIALAGGGPFTEALKDARRSLAGLLPDGAQA